MKRYLFLLLIVIFCVSHLAAVGGTDEVNGPVKQMTVTLRLKTGNYSLYYGEQPGTCGKTIFWYDSIGRIIEKADYVGDRLQSGYVCQYTINNICMEYDYTADGLVKGSFAQVKSDSLGNRIYTKRYKEGRVCWKDSTVYNALGQKTEYYETPYKSDTLALRYVYQYDSLGRLSKVCETFHGTEHNYTIEYFPKGNYTEHHSQKNGTMWDRKYVVSKNGYIVDIKEPNHHSHYSKFDKYGNWLILEGSVHNLPGPVTERTIEYYDK